MSRPANKKVREKILYVAANIFFKNGFYKVSISELVRELRTSKSTIYKYFNSKDAIVEALLDEFNAEVDRKLQQIVTDERSDFRKKLEAVTAHTCQMLSRVQRPFFKDLRIHTPTLWDRYEKARKRRLNRFYRSLFMEGKNQDLIRKDINIDFMLLLYTKMTEVLISPNSLDNFPFSNKAAYKMITRLFLEGALADKGKKHEK